MSPRGRLARARQLTASVWPSRGGEGDREVDHARLRRLAAAQSTGILPFTAPAPGAIHFLDGNVVHAESAGTPRPAAHQGAGDAAALAPATHPLSALLAATEPAVDAVLDLLAGDWQAGRFRPGEPGSASPPGASPPAPIPVETLLAEITRRQRVLEQMAPVLSADTPVTRHPRLSHPGVRVTARQWALLIRVPDRATPRQLAWELGHSVFATTIEVYRLLVLGLLAPAGRSSGASPGSRPEPDSPGLPRLSFLGAVLAGPPAGGTAGAP